MTPNEKNHLLDALSIVYNRANYLKAVAEESGDKETSAQLGRRMDRLRLELDGLLRDFYHQWIGDAETLNGDILRRNQAIQAHLDAIKDSADRAKQFVEAIGYLDEVIELAAALVK